MKKTYEEKEDYILCLDVENRKKHINVILFNEFKKYHGDNTLFLGCNNGSSTTLLAPHCKNLVGIDINKKALDIAEQYKKQYNVPNVTYIHQNIVNLNLEQKFDCVYALQFLEHIYEEDIPVVLKNINDVLKVDGYFLIQVPHFTAHHFNEVSHVYHFKSEEHIKEVLGKYFDIISINHETRGNPGLPGKHNDWTIICKKKEIVIEEAPSKIDVISVIEPQKEKNKINLYLMGEEPVIEEIKPVKKRKPRKTKK
jgi:ubiquinone/menaquinone biosynthesis C-methylase UbiE